MGFWFLLQWSLWGGGFGGLGVGHLALGVIPRLTSSSLCVCVCIGSVKPLDVGTTKIRDPKVGAIFAI
jgi:hypothetical protein